MKTTTSVKPPEDAPVPLRSVTDPLELRRAIYEQVFTAASQLEPARSDRYVLQLTNVHWADPERFTRSQRKEAVLTGQTLARRLRGTWELRDAATGKLLEKRNQVIASVPYLSSLGTFILRGNEYTLLNQQRLRPGVFVRRRETGDVEAHVNVLPGQGASHRYFLDPDRGLFKVRIGQGELPLLPILRALGATDEEIKQAWGPKLYAANTAVDRPEVLQRAAQALDRYQRLGASPEERLRNAFARMTMDPEVTRQTLGLPAAVLDKNAILAATRRILAVSRGEDDPDDRDHLAFHTFYGPEDLFRERIVLDHGKLRHKAVQRVFQEGTLKSLPSGLMTAQLEEAFFESGLGQALEEINPIEVLDRLTRSTRMGEGGIPSVESIPDESRSVQPSHMGFVDPVRVTENQRVGVDVFLAASARKGADGFLYAPMIDPRTGKTVWRNPRQLVGAVVSTSDAWQWPTKRVPAYRNGRLVFARRDEVNYIIHGDDRSYSPLSNLVPFKKTNKPDRLLMGTRYFTQALPLEQAEAALVQNLTPDGKDESYDERYGPFVGAVKARQAGRVESLDQGVLTVRYDDGTRERFELYENYPFNRKTYIHQTPLVQPGSRFEAGQALIRSNYTDDQGRVALGVNLRTAYLPYRGYNFKDAVVISESAARKLSSQHMYQHQVEVTDQHRMGKKAYLGLFPARFDRKTLEPLDERGVVRPGTVVEKGQPLILAARQKPLTYSKIHRRKEPAYADETVVWEHEDPGVVTDVRWGKYGPVVAVRSLSPARVGDKLSGKYGDKGVIAAILPDAQMPTDAQGRPFDLLFSPLIVVSRANPGQLYEGWLGKLARKLGKPVKVPDFSSQDDLVEWTKEQLRKHGISDREDVYDPVSQRKIPGVITGERYIMKLQHTAESKAAGRGSGAYTTEEAPAKGGETGCFVGATPVWVRRRGRWEAWPIRRVVAAFRRGLRLRVAGGRVTDVFSYLVPRDELVEIVLEDGSRLVATASHVFYTARGRAIVAARLRPGMTLRASLTGVRPSC